MLENNTKSKKGFTIIEVVLVLAIAGLIMLMVFVALPAMQRSQRNTQRKEDMSRVAAAMTEYQGNNHNKTPNEVSETNGGGFGPNSNFYKTYLGGENGFSGPNNAYEFKPTNNCPIGTGSCSAGDVELTSGDEKIAYFVNAKCTAIDSTSTDPSTVVEPASTKTELKRKIAFVIKMEGSDETNGNLYCVNN